MISCRIYAPPSLAGGIRPPTEPSEACPERRRRLSPPESAHEACRMDGDRLPRASAVQELVAAWKLLWGRRRRGPVGRG